MTTIPAILPDLPLIPPAYAIVVAYGGQVKAARSPTSYPPACIVRSGDTQFDEAFVPRRTGL